MSEGVACSEEQPVVEEPTTSEERSLEERGTGRVSWLLALAVVLSVIVVYAALGYAAYLIARALV
jgi:hypothetical protein